MYGTISKHAVICVILVGTIRVNALPPYMTDFQSPYIEDFNTFLRPTAKRHSHHVSPKYEQSFDEPIRYYASYRGSENPESEGDLRVKIDQTPDIYDLDSRSEYADSNLVKALNGEEMKVTGGNGATGAYNKYPESVVPGHTEKTSGPVGGGGGSEENELIHEIDEELAAAMQSGNSPDINPYPTPPNPCPLPYPDEEGQITPYTAADDCIPKWSDDAELSRWFQNQQVGKSDAEHNQGVDKGHVKKSPDMEQRTLQLPSYLREGEKRESIRAKKGAPNFA